MPKYIIGYYSGENKRIKDIIRPYENQVWSDLKRNTGLEKGLRRLFFAETYHAQMILLTLLLYQKQLENTIFRDRVKYLIDEFTSFINIEKFNLNLKQPSWYISSNKLHNSKSIFQLEENLLRDLEFPFWGIKGKASKIISFFYNNIKSDPIYYVDEGGGDKNEVIEKLDLNSIDCDTIYENIYKEFDHAVNFFDAFESLIQIDSIISIQLKVKSSRGNNVSFDFTQLSEGEQQLITVLGLILITGKDDCLFLLDEPDTHLNPQWQREYVGLLDYFNLNNDNSHIIVATHSPLIVQAAEKADIFLYKETENGDIKVSNEDFSIQNWRIDQVLTSEYFDLYSARPPQLDSYMSLREKILSEGEITSETESKLRNLENEFGTLPTGETRDEIDAFLLIKSIIDNYKDKP